MQGRANVLQQAQQRQQVAAFNQENSFDDGSRAFLMNGPSQAFLNEGMGINPYRSGLSLGYGGDLNDLYPVTGNDAEESTPLFAANPEPDTNPVSSPRFDPLANARLSLQNGSAFLLAANEVPTYGQMMSDAGGGGDEPIDKLRLSQPALGREAQALNDLQQRKQAIAEQRAALMAQWPDQSEAETQRLGQYAGGGLDPFSLKELHHDVLESVMQYGPPDTRAGESTTPPATLSSLASNFGLGLKDVAYGLTAGTVRNAWDLYKAAYSFAWNEGLQPVIEQTANFNRQLGDYLMGSNTSSVELPKWYPEMTGPIAEAYRGGESQGRLIGSNVPGINLGIAAYDLYSAGADGNLNGVARIAGNLTGGVAIGGLVGRYGDYGVGLTDINAVGPMASQRGSLGLKLVGPEESATNSTAALEIGLRADGLPSRLYHYTNEAGMNGIVNSETLNPSLKALNPNDVRYGNGQYLSDIAPGTKTPAQLSKAFINNPFQGARYTNFVEIDTTNLNLIQGRSGVYVVPNEVPLNLQGLITNSGKVLAK